MIGGASKLDSVKLSFWQFMSSSTFNNMLLFQGLCVGAGALMYSMAGREKRNCVGIWITSLLLVGSIPFIAAETVNAELPESGDIYAFFRGSSTKTRDFSTANFSASDVSVNGCGLDTCLLTGKHEIIMSLFPGSMVNVDIVEDPSYQPEVVKILVHDFNQKQGLVYDYSQYDYGIGIVEGNTVDDTEALPTENWWKEAKFADNADNYIDTPWEIKDYRKLPNNLRTHHFASDAGGQECGSWANTGDFYSRQVIIPKEEGISFFYTDSDVQNGGLFEVIHNGVSHFKTLDEMKNGFELKSGLEVMLISHDKPSPKSVRMFCHHKNNTGFGKCFDYNYPSLGNPSQQGPGHFQSSRKLTKGVEFTNGNYFYGRTDWKEKINWFRDSGCDSKAAKMSFGSTEESRAADEVTFTQEEKEWISDLGNLNFKALRMRNGLDVSKKIRELRKSGFINLEGVNKRFIVRGKGNFWVNKDQKNSEKMSRSEMKMSEGEISVFEMFGLSDDERKRKIMGEMAKSQRGLIAWIIFMILAALVIAAITVGVMWADIKDNCCGINRFGYSDFKNIDAYGRPINDTLGAYKTEIEWSGLENLGEPMNNYLLMRETEEVRGRFTLTASSAEVKINHDVVTIQGFEIKKCDAVMSGTTGSCDIVYETIGAGGMVKLEATGMKLNNAIMNMKAGQNMVTIGINSVSFAGSIVKICISGTEMCSSVTVTFVGKPDGSGGDTLDSGSPFGSPYMTMQEMFENKGFLTTFVLVCIVSGLLGILMLLTLGYLIRDYIRPNMQGVDLKSLSIALMFLVCVISPAEAVTVFGMKNSTVADVRNAGLSVSGILAADSWNTALYNHAFYVIHNNDIPFMKRCSSKAQMLFYEGPGQIRVTGLSANVCTPTATNTTVIPVDKAPIAAVNFFFLSPRFLGSYYVTGHVSMIPYTGQRAVEDRFAFFSGPQQSTYFFEVKTGKWFQMNQIMNFKEVSVDASRMRECTEVKWHRYASVCPTNSTLDTKSMNKGLCYGCYGQYICGATRGDGLNLGSNYACTMSAESTSVVNNATGLAYLTNLGVFGLMSLETYRASDSYGYRLLNCGNTTNTDNIEACSKSTVFNGLGGTLASTLEILTLKGVTDGVNDFGFISEFIVNVGLGADNLTVVDMCDVLTNLDITSGPINCIKKDNSMQCIAYCEMMAPVRPGSEIGMVKMEMKAAGPRNHNSLLNRSKGKKQKIISELMKKDRKKSRFSVLESQRDGRAISSVDYKDMFITYDGVVLGIKLGGPHRLSCFYGNEISTFCNSTEGFGWVSGINLKPIAGKSGQTMYIPDSYVYVTFSLDGQDCEGVLTDVSGELTCDTTCCITSFDDFESFIHVYAGTRIVPTSRLAISFVDQNTGRSASSSSGKVYPQGVDEYYNSTCARGSGVAELWICLQDYYPDVFWALMGTIIAFGATAMILVVWRLGLKNTGKKAWSGTKKAGGWIAEKSKNAAKWISNRVERANIMMKISISETLIETCKRILKDPESYTDSEYNKVNLIKAKLEQKHKTWKAKMNAKKVGKNKYEKIPKERGEERMTLAGLESVRMTLMEICSNSGMMDEKEKMSRLGKSISKAKESLEKVKMESKGRSLKRN
jgi:hypothetical protein